MYFANTKKCYTLKHTIPNVSANRARVQVVTSAQETPMKKYGFGNKTLYEVLQDPSMIPSESKTTFCDKETGKPIPLMGDDPTVRIRAGMVLVGSGAGNALEAYRTILPQYHLDASKVTFADAKASKTHDGQHCDWGDRITDMFVKESNSNSGVDTVHTTIQLRSYRAPAGAGPMLWLLFLPKGQEASSTYCGYVLEKEGTATLCVYDAKQKQWSTLAFDPESDAAVLNAYTQAGKLSGAGLSSSSLVDSQATTDTLLMVGIATKTQFPASWTGLSKDRTITVYIRGKTFDFDRRRTVDFTEQIAVDRECSVQGLQTMVSALFMERKRHVDIGYFVHHVDDSLVKVMPGTLLQHGISDGHTLFVREKPHYRSLGGDHFRGGLQSVNQQRHRSAIAPGKVKPGVRIRGPSTEPYLLYDMYGRKIVPDESITPIVYEYNFTHIGSGGLGETENRMFRGCIESIGATQRAAQKAFPFSTRRGCYLSTGIPVDVLDPETFHRCITSALQQVHSCPTVDADKLCVAINLNNKPKPEWLQKIVPQDTNEVSVADVITVDEGAPSWIGSVKLKINA